jgi:WD40 repeat protein
VSGSRDKTIRIWNLETKTQEGVLEGHTHYVRTVALTSDNLYIVSGSGDNTLRVWNLQTRAQEFIFNGILGIFLLFRLVAITNMLFLEVLTALLEFGTWPQKPKKLSLKAMLDG